MATKTKEYCDTIEHMKQQALTSGLGQIIIAARDLHNQLSTNVPTVPTCCNAMKSMMLEGDQYIDNPKTNCGYSINLVIKYDLHDMEQRPVLYKPKKRGRKNTKKFSLDEFLQMNEMKYTVRKNLYEVIQDEGIWYIYVASKQQTQLDKMMFDIFRVVSDRCFKISILSKHNKKITGDWEKLSQVVKTRLNMSLMVIDYAFRLKELH